MLKRIEEEMVRYVWWLKPMVERDGGEPKVAMPARPAPRRPQALSYSSPSDQPPSVFGGRAATPPAPPAGNDLMQDRAPARVGGDDVIKTVKRDEPKIGRNDPCWCGSGKKFKKCHGA
jgi:preprotein translocase subunit SecA